MSAQRLCVTVERDYVGNAHDEEAWVTVDWRVDDDAWPRAVEAFVAYLAERGVPLGGLHVGTEDWIRDYPNRYAG